MNRFDASEHERFSALGRAAVHGRVHLACIEATVALADVLRDQQLMSLLVEDTCLRVAIQDWFTRLPPHRRRKDRALWRSEGARLRRDTARLRILVEQLPFAS